MPSVCVVSFTDMSAETGTFSFYLPAIAGDGSNYAAILAARDAFLTVLDASFDGQIKEHKLYVDLTRVSNVKPSDGDREEKIEIRYQDDTTIKIHNMTIPCRDKANWDWEANSDFADLSGGVVTAQDNFVAAFNTNVKSPEGNAVTIISIEKVGRNL